MTTSLSAFGFTQVVAATQTQVVGYAEAFCPGSGSFPYVPPTGWTCTACTYEGVGTYGGCSYCGMVLVTLTPNSSTYYLDSSDVITPNVGGNCATVNPADQAACYADNAANTPTCTAYCSGTTYYGCNSGIATAGVIEIGQCGCTCMSSVCISGTYYPCSGGVIQTGIPDSTYCTSMTNTNTTPVGWLDQYGCCEGCGEQWCETIGSCIMARESNGVAAQTCPAANTPTCTAYCSGTTYYGCNSGIATAGVIEIGQCGCTCMSSVCISGTYYPCSGGVIQTGIPDSTYCTSTATTTTNAQSADITLYAVVGGLLVVAAAVALFLGSKSSQSSPPPPSSPPPKQ